MPKDYLSKKTKKSIKDIDKLKFGESIKIPIKIDFKELESDSEEENLVAEWEDISWDDGSGTLSIYKRRGKFECEWNNSDEHTWLTMNDLDMPMSQKDLKNALKPLKLGKPDTGKM